jgi:hypothetical protein
MNEPNAGELLDKIVLKYRHQAMGDIALGQKQ